MFTTPGDGGLVTATDEILFSVGSCRQDKKPQLMPETKDWEIPKN